MHPEPWFRVKGCHSTPGQRRARRLSGRVVTQRLASGFVRPYQSGVVPLPFIDEHRQRVAPDAAWEALVQTVAKVMSSSPRFAAFLRCDPDRTSADFAGRLGETITGFRVDEVVPGRKLVLRGEHRFSRYELSFLLDGNELRAETRAEFPGLLGRLYRAAVIRSSAHRRITKRILRQIARASRRRPRPAS